MADDTNANQKQTQEPQEVLVDKANVQEAVVISTLNKATFTFKGFDFAKYKFRYKYMDNGSQNEIVEIMDLKLKEVTEPNPNYDKNKPTTDTNQPNITYQVGTYEFTQDWLNNFYNTSFNGNSATFQIEIFSLNAQFLQVVDNTITIACKDSPIITPIQGLLPLPFSNPFAEIGIRGAVPQETPEGSDELSWKSGYTEPYQRPTNRDGKWIKMGQYNQILHDITKSALILQDNLSILAGYINDEVDIKLNETKDKIDNELSKPPANAVLLTGNQSVAGLKNFQGININNFKNTTTAVANIELAQGLPYWGVQKTGTLNLGASLTITNKNVQFIHLFYCHSVQFLINNKTLFSLRNYYLSFSPSAIVLRNKDIFLMKEISTLPNASNSYAIYGS